MLGVNIKVWLLEKIYWFYSQIIGYVGIGYRYRVSSLEYVGVDERKWVRVCFGQWEGLGRVRRGVKGLFWEIKVIWYDRSLDWEIKCRGWWRETGLERKLEVRL